MRRLGLRTTYIVIVCFILALLLLPCAGNTTGVYAQETYVKITSPQDGDLITAATFEVTADYSRKAVNDNVIASIYPVGSPRGNGYSKGLGPGLNGTASFDSASLFQTAELTGSPGQYEISVEVTESVFKPGTRQVIREQTVAEDKIIIDYQPIGIAIDFTRDPAKVKVGEKVTLKWKVTGATSVSIDQGVGNVSAEGSKPVVPTQVIATDTLPHGLFPIYMARYTLTATNSAGTATKEQTVEVEPKSREEIVKLYEAWGYSTEKQHWADGTEEAQPLVGTAVCGASNNFWDFMTDGMLGHNRFNCIAMQYKTLVFLNELKKEGTLLGWDYMPVTGPMFPYPQHNAVVMWPEGTAYDRTGEILDPHGKQGPYSYPVTSEFYSGVDINPLPYKPSFFTSWKPDIVYSDVYPGIGAGTAYNQGEYLLDNFEKNPEKISRWGRGSQKTPWEKMGTVSPPGGPAYADYQELQLNCPVDLLITNLAGQRLGMLPDGQWVTEFEPLDSYYWNDSDANKQWFFALPKDTYKTTITGTGTGNFHLTTYASGGEVQDYGENPIAAGEQATLTIDPQKGAELILADGQTVTPTIASPPSVPELGTRSGPGPQPEPGTQPETAPGTATIQISSTPSGAEVYINGELQGESPIIVTDVAPATYSITLKKQDYEDYSTVVTVTQATTATNFTASLKPRKGTAVNISGFKFGSILIAIAAAAVVVAAVLAGTLTRRKTARAKVAEAAPAPAPAPAPPPPSPSAAKTVEVPQPEAPTQAPPRRTRRAPAAIPASAKSKFCPNCGDPIAKGEQFCDKCGIKLKAVVRSSFCPKCGDPISKEEKFCNNCGAKLV